MNNTTEKNMSKTCFSSQHNELSLKQKAKIRTEILKINWKYYNIEAFYSNPFVKNAVSENGTLASLPIRTAVFGDCYLDGEIGLHGITKIIREKIAHNFETELRLRDLTKRKILITDSLSSNTKIKLIDF